jgi:hypothetical protein
VSGINGQGYQTSYVTDQWLRKCSLIVSNDQKGLDLSQFRIKFQIRQADPIAAKPKTAWIRVYNLAPTTIGNTNSVTGIVAEYTTVTLQAGYQTGAFGIIFQGTIKQFRAGHETAVDSFFDIMAADGDIAYNFAVTNKALAAGATLDDAIKAHQDALSKLGATPGYNDLKTSGAAGGGVSTSGGLPGGINPTFLRGPVLHGMARAGMTNSANQAGATWVIENGKVQIVKTNGFAPGEAVVLNSGTGLIGWPEQTESGIYARCLLNPNIKIQGQVQIDNQSLNAQQGVSPINQNLTPPGRSPFVNFPSVTDFRAFATVAADGLYRVLVVEHEGDTRGNPWYTNLILLQSDQSKGAQPTDQSTPVP